MMVTCSSTHLSRVGMTSPYSTNHLQLQEQRKQLISLLKEKYSILVTVEVGWNSERSFLDLRSIIILLDFDVCLIQEHLLTPEQLSFMNIHPDFCFFGVSAIYSSILLTGRPSLETRPETQGYMNVLNENSAWS